MRSSLVVFSILLMIGSAFAQGVTGTWETYDDESGELQSVVKIYEKSGKIYGKIIELHNVKPFNMKGENNEPICVNCTDYRKNKPLKGMKIISGLKKDGNEWYADNAILDPNNGTIYDCKIWLESNDELAVRGYVGWFFRTQYWKRKD